MHRRLSNKDGIGPMSTTYYTGKVFIIGSHTISFYDTKTTSDKARNAKYARMVSLLHYGTSI
eukprot:5807307-Amphidinium_carterae.1